jgi:hypothetical protein
MGTKHQAAKRVPIEVAVIGNGATETFDYLYSIKNELGGPTPRPALAGRGACRRLRQ